MVKFKKENKENKFKFLEKRKYLDPFYYVDTFIMPKIKEKTDSKLVENLVNVLFAAMFALVIYFLLSLTFGSSSPLVIVYSASMEPFMVRGDVIGLLGINDNVALGKEINLNENIKNIPVEKYLTIEKNNVLISKIIFKDGQEVYLEKNGSVIVYPSYPNKLPIIHRSIVKINANDGVFVLTKGDNYFTNPTIDQDCGTIDLLRNSSSKNCITFFAIPIDEIQGVAFFNIPKVGCVKLWLFDDLFSLISTGRLPRDFRGIC